eukprot:3841406-Pyramimonas_sp.AAC.1
MDVFTPAKYFAIGCLISERTFREVHHHRGSAHGCWHWQWLARAAARAHRQLAQGGRVVKQVAAASPSPRRRLSPNGYGRKDDDSE